MLLEKACNPILHFYGHIVPYHRGKWLVFDQLIRGLKLGKRQVRRVNRRGLVWELDLGSYLDCRLYYLGIHEPWETRFVECVTRPGFVFFDVGANIGYFTLLAAKRVGLSGEVHSFEPSPEEFTKLSRNVRLNGFGMVRLNRKALSDSPGRVYITETRSAGTTRIATDSDLRAREVEAVSLDSYVDAREVSRLNLIKVDIEGAEYRFLLGGVRTIRRFRPILIMELNPNALEAFGSHPGDIIRFAKSEHYSLYRPRPKGLAPLRKLPSGIEFVNVVALPSQRSRSGAFIPWSSVAKWATA